VNRRRFLSRAYWLVAAAHAWPVWAAPRLDRDPFTLGVASGEPSSDGFVLWTRLAPDPLAGGGMPPMTVPIEWRVANDERLARVVARGTVNAVPAHAHAVHVEVSGLVPDRWYWYQFSVGSGASRHVSAVGRTRTAPSAGTVTRQLCFALASCQKWEDGFFTAFQRMADEDIDCVVHVGDYIYEGGPRRDKVREQPLEPCMTLEQYRLRYAFYKRDEHLQRAHAMFPWIVTPDDHEVSDNYAGGIPDWDSPLEGFLDRRAAAYQAYYEHMPLRASARPAGPDMRICRALGFGRLATFHLLDTRQFRSDQPCGDREKHSCPERMDPARTMLGAAQEQWLFDGLRHSPAQWNLLTQQVIAAQLNLDREGGETFAMDKWDGYPVARQRLLDFLGDARPANPVVLSGDNHNNWVFDLKRSFGNERDPAVATEFVSTSITSNSDGADMREDLAHCLGINPHARYLNSRRGYVRLRVTRERLQADFRVLPYVTRPDAPIRTDATFIVESGRPGAIRG